MDLLFHHFSFCLGWAFNSEKALASVLFIEIFHWWVMSDVGVDSCLISYLQNKTKKQTNKQTKIQAFVLFVFHRDKIWRNLKFLGVKSQKYS
jgi:hypothetical protein